jgi:ATP-dependent protease ClpP protease subunit
MKNLIHQYCAILTIFLSLMRDIYFYFSFFIFVTDLTIVTYFLYRSRIYHKMKLLLVRMYHRKKFLILMTRWQKRNNSRLMIISENLEKIHQSDYYDIGSDRDVMRFVSQLNSFRSDQMIDILLHTSGGDSYNTKVMIDVLMNHRGEKRIYIPYYAYSAGTMIALTGSKIYMNRNSHLSPIDSQMTIHNDQLFQTSIPVGILSQLSHIYPSNENNLLMIHSKMAKKDFYADSKILNMICDQQYTPQKKKKIIQWFLRTKLPHQYPISVTEAREFGMKISCQMPPEMNEMATIYLFN